MEAGQLSPIPAGMQVQPCSADMRPVLRGQMQAVLLRGHFTSH